MYEGRLPAFGPSGKHADAIYKEFYRCKNLNFQLIFFFFRSKHILIRKRNAKILKHHFLEKNHCDGIFSDITYEYFSVSNNQSKLNFCSMLH